MKKKKKTIKKRKKRSSYKIMQNLAPCPCFICRQKYNLLERKPEQNENLNDRINNLK